MAKRMLIDATHPEETRVVVVSGTRVEEFDYESSNKTQVKGNIYLAKITRVEPSLQAAFVEYGGNRHGFLPFSEIHPDYYRIPIADREALEAEEEEIRRAEEIARAQRGDANDDDDDLDENGRLIDVDTDQEISEVHGSGFDGDDDTTVTDGIADDLSSDKLSADQAHEGDAPQGHDVVGDTIQAGDADRLDDDQGDDHDDDRDDDRDGGNPDQDGRGRGRRRRRRGSSSKAARASVQEIQEDPAPSSASAASASDLDEVARRRARLMRRYKIQEVIKRRQVLLIQVTKEERGNKGAALTTYLSLAGRYCVLMPNTAKGGGISRKISSVNDRRRLKTILNDLEIVNGMAVIVRTAGSQRTKTEIRRDYEYLLRLWNDIRNRTMESVAPSLIHEEANLIKRSMRDLYSREMDEVLVEGEAGYKAAKSYMRMLTPSHAKNVKLHSEENMPLFHKFRVEEQLNAMHATTVTLRAGGSIVLNQTEALVAIDVNSGKATRERHIETTALKTNLEAAEEVARQLRLRDLAGLIVIDFIDMEDPKHNREVERRLKESMTQDRARIQLGRISPFGLLELSRQRLRPSLFEWATESCSACNGTGWVRATDSAALQVLRALIDEAVRQGAGQIQVKTPTRVALYLLNENRAQVVATEQRYGVQIMIRADEDLGGQEYQIERLSSGPLTIEGTAEEVVESDQDFTAPDDQDESDDRDDSRDADSERRGEEDDTRSRQREKRGGRRRRGEREARQGGDDREARQEPSDSDQEVAAQADEQPSSRGDDQPDHGDHDGDDGNSKRRRRGKRGGRRRGRRRDEETAASASSEQHAADSSDGPATTQPAADRPVESAPSEDAADSGAASVDDGTARVTAQTTTGTTAQATTQATVETVTEPTAESAEPAPAGPTDEAKPKTSRRRPRKAADAPSKAASEAEGDADKPKPRRRSRKKVDSQAAGDDKAAETVDQATEATEATDAQSAAPLTRQRRTRKPKAVTIPIETVESDGSGEEAAEQAKPKTRRRRTAKKSAPDAERQAESQTSSPAAAPVAAEQPKPASPSQPSTEASRPSPAATPPADSAPAAPTPNAGPSQGDTTVADAPAKASRRKGWWNRLLE